MVSRTVKLAGIVLTGVLTAACTSMADLPAGTSLQEVQAQYGAPSFSCPGANGGERLIWSQQPFGQYAWGTNVDSNGNTDRVVSLLTDSNFSQLASGTWTPERVRCEFGPPAEVSSVGLPSSTSIVWSYRYRQSGAWNSLMHVYFDPATDTVTRFHAGPDPMYEERDSFWFM